MARTIYILICVCLGKTAGGQLTLTVQPSQVDMSEPHTVMIRCSMDIVKRNTVVYSVMIKRRGTSCAVLFRNGKVETHEKHITVDSYVVNKTTASLQLKLENITCEDRGDYSCKMAVRRSYRNLQLGPVVSPFKVISESRPSGISFDTDPQKTLYTDGEIIRVTCSTLHRNKVTGWSWIFNNETIDVTVDSCSYSEEDCLYRCSSTFHHLVSVKDNGVMFVCGVGGMTAGRTLEVINDTSTNDDISSSASSTFDNTTSNISLISGVDRKHTNPSSVIVISSITAVVIFMTVAMVIVFSRLRRNAGNNIDNITLSDHREDERNPLTVDEGGTQLTSNTGSVWFKSPRRIFQLFVSGKTDIY